MLASAERSVYIGVMNKAFVREPDDDGQRRCPRCDSFGQPVGEATLAAHLPAEALQSISDMAFFCPFPRCDVAYFDDFERFLTVDQLRAPVYPKDPAAPMCACFGLGRDEIDLDIQEGTVERTRALVERAKSPEAHCREAAANGQSCVGEVQRYYMQARQAAQDSAS